MAILTERSDVIVAHDPELLPAIIVSGALGRMVVFDVHENIPAQLATRAKTPAPLRSLTSTVARWLLRMADRVGVVTLAEPGYAGLVAAGAPVFANLPAPGTLPLRTADADGVVYVGDITVERGAEVLVEAVGRLEPSPRLTMIGRCSDSLARRLEDRARASGTALDLPGFLPYETAWREAAHHLVGVSPLLDRPNYRNSLPTKLLEYRSVGLVVVASDLPGSQSALEGSLAASMVAPGDVDALAAEIDRALHDPTRAAAAIDEVDDVRSQAWDAEGFAAFYRGLIDDRR